MRQRALAVLLTLLFTACGPTIQGYPLRGPRPRESRQVAELLDPLLITLELPSLRIIAASSDCKIGFAVARTRSEERRVGKECSSRATAYDEQKQQRN